MGRKIPSRGLPPASLRRDARSKRAKATLNKDVPALLKAYPKALEGVKSAELIVNPPRTHDELTSNGALAQKETSQDVFKPVKSQSEELDGRQKQKSPLQIQVQIADTIQAAHRLLNSTEDLQSYKGRIALLNMASPLRAGGGFLTGAQAQEETLCLRTTLYPSLYEEFYRLPELGVVYTRDVLVFRGWDVTFADLPKHERFFVDVVTAAMLRFPDIDAEEGSQPKYADPKDRELVEKKMRAVMRVLKSKRVKRVVLGAWGCGAYNNPLEEVALLWRKVLLPDTPTTIHKSTSASQEPKTPETWGEMQIVFAINDPAMAKCFATVFELATEDLRTNNSESNAVLEDQSGRAALIEEMQAKIEQTSTQLAQARYPELKARLEAVLTGLKKQMLNVAAEEKDEDI